MFSLLCKRAKEAVSAHWDLIFEIVHVNVNTVKNYNLRLDMLELIEYFIMNDDLKSDLVFYGDIMLKMTLVPCL